MKRPEAELQSPHLVARRKVQPRIFLLVCLVLAFSLCSGSALGFVLDQGNGAIATGGPDADIVTIPSFEVPDGSKRLLAVAVSHQLSSGTVESVQFGGQMLTHAVTGGQGLNYVVEIWYLPLGDGSPISRDIKVTLSGPSESIQAGAVSFTNVAHDEPIATTRSTGGVGQSSSTLTLTTIADNAVFDAVAANRLDSLTLSPGANQTLLFSTDNPESLASSVENAIGVSTEVTWNFGNRRTYAHAAVSIRSDSNEPQVVEDSDEGNILIGGNGDDQLIGNGGDDVISGRGGDDLLVGDSLDGTASGQDDISGGRGNDTIIAGPLDDLIDPGPGNNCIDGGSELNFDTVEFDLSPYPELQGREMRVESQGDGRVVKLVADNPGPFVIVSDNVSRGPATAATRGAHADECMSLAGLEPFAFVNTLYNVEKIVGTPNNDRFIGSSGRDWFFGGDGDDFMSGSTGIALLDGGDGTDTVSFQSATGGVRANLCGLTSDGVESNIGRFRLHNFENLTGTEFGDALLVNTFQEAQCSLSLISSIVKGLAGNDTLYPGPGPTVLDGGEGNDFVSYHYFPEGVRLTLPAPGRNIPTSVRTSYGTDQLISIEAAVGSRFNDRLSAWTSATTITPVLIGGEGDDTLVGSRGDDILDGGPGDDLLQGGLGDDKIHPGSGFNRIEGGPGLDYLDLLRAEENRRIQEENERIEENLSIVEMRREAEELEIWLRQLAGARGSESSGEDPVVVTEYTLTVVDVEFIGGGDFDDFMRGSEWDDNFLGHGGNDRLLGVGGSNSLSGGPGDDWMSGGPGNDVYPLELADLEGHDLIDDSGGFDRLRFVDFEVDQVSLAEQGQDGQLVLMFVDGGSLAIDRHFANEDAVVEQLETEDCSYFISTHAGFTSGSIEQLLVLEDCLVFDDGFEEATRFVR